jgi:preprotein translocase subunit SecB
MSDEAAATEKPRGQFGLQRIYVKDLSFESPASPAVFTQEWKPETNVQFGTAMAKVGEHQYEVVLQVTATVRNGSNVAFIAEVKQAGIFHAEGLEGEALERLLGAQCPSILFPYAREVVSDLVARGTFPQLLLQPMNFDAVFAEAKRRAQQPPATPAH